MYRSTRINLLILILFSCIFASNVKALVNPTPEFYVNDYANVLSEETEKYIIKKSNELYKVDGTQIVVVTIPNLGGESIEEYSLNLARSFGIGSKEKNNGLLLLLALEERESRIEVGTGLEGIMPDGKTGRFQDQYMIPFYKQNDFDTGIKNGYDAFFNEIVKLNNLNLETTEPKEGSSSSEETLFIGRCFLFGGLGFIIGLIAKLIGALKGIFTKIYLVGGVILLIILFRPYALYFFYLFVHLIGFALGRFNEPTSTLWEFGSGGGSFNSSHSHSHSSHSSSSSRSSGGGGGFSGGGSTRRF